MAAEILKRAETEDQYARILATGDQTDGALRLLKCHPQTLEPKRLKLEEIWTNKEITSPGNICVIAEEDKPDRLLIFSGWRAVCEVSAAGRLRERHELPIPPQAAISYLRTAQDAAGKRHYLAAAPLSPAFFLLNENWELTLTHPADYQPLQLGDAQLARLTGTEELAVYAGYVDLAGLQAITLSGKTTAAAVLSKCPERRAGKERHGSRAGLLVTGDSGTVLRVSGSGSEQPHALTSLRWSGGCREFQQCHAVTVSRHRQRRKGEAVAIGSTPRPMEVAIRAAGWRPSAAD
jgi:hypothetical protein